MVIKKSTEIYPKKVFSIKGLIKTYRKYIIITYTVISLTLLVISILYYLSSEIKLFPIFESLLRILNIKSFLPSIASFLINTVLILISLAIFFIIIFFIGVIVYKAYIAYRRSASYNLLYESKNVTHIPSLIIPKVSFERPDGFILDFKNDIGKFREASFNINYIKATDKNNNDLDWNIGIFLLSEGGGYIFLFHPYLRRKESRFIKLAFFHEDIDKDKLKDRRIEDTEIEIEGFCSYKLELFNGKLGCYINGEKKMYKNIPEPVLKKDIHLIRFQIWPSRAKEIEIIEASIKDLKIEWI